MKALHIIVILAAAFCASCAGCNLTPGNKAKVGTIIKISSGGIACTTWEATMIRGGLTDGSGGFAAPFNFTVPADLVDEVEAAMDSGKEVKIVYEEEGIYSFCRSGSLGSFLKSIEYVRPSSEAVKAEEKP